MSPTVSASPIEMNIIYVSYIVSHFVIILLVIYTVFSSDWFVNSDPNIKSLGLWYNYSDYNITSNHTKNDLTVIRGLALLIIIEYVILFIAFFYGAHKLVKSVLYLVMYSLFCYVVSKIASRHTRDFMDTNLISQGYNIGYAHNVFNITCLVSLFLTILYGGFLYALVD